LKQLVSAGIFASSLTLPYVWFVFPYLFLGKYSLSLGLSELFAWLVEALFYKMFLKISFKNAIIASFIANLLSYSLGYFLGRYLILA
jgi:spore maturation protein SpmA